MESSVNNTTGTAGGTSASMPDVNQIKQQAGQMASQFVDQARGQITGQLDSQKSRAAENLGGVAQALRSTGEHLRMQEQAPIAQVAEQAAGVVDNVSGYLRDARIEDMVADVETFARRQPALFFGGAFALGFLAVRFLKSSGTSYSGGTNGYSSYGGTRQASYGYQAGDNSPYAHAINSGGTELPTAYDRAMESSGTAYATGSALESAPTVSSTGATGSGAREMGGVDDAALSPTTPAMGVESSSAMGDAYDLEDTDQMTETGTGSGSSTL